MRRTAILAPLLLAAACSGGGDATGTITADEDRRLNAAAEMLDANSVALEEVADNGTQP